MAVQGLQLKWVAPLDFLVELGVESGNGDYFPGTRENSNGLNGVIAYVRAGGDLGDSIAWRTGLSYVDIDAVDREFEDVNAAGQDVLNAFTGSSETSIVDGDLSYSDAASTLDGGYSSDQSGWYVQGVCRFLPWSRFGARYDSLDTGDTKIGLVRDGTSTADDFSILLPATPTRTSLMLDWSPSEFSRLRAQYAWDEASEGPTDQQLFLQYIYALGAHGAHKF
jgi:hypothetical protein